MIAPLAVVGEFNIIKDICFHTLNCYGASCILVRMKMMEIVLRQTRLSQRTEWCLVSAAYHVRKFTTPLAALGPIFCASGCSSIYTYTWWCPIQIFTIYCINLRNRVGLRTLKHTPRDPSHNGCEFSVGSTTSHLSSTGSETEKAWKLLVQQMHL